MNSDGYLRRTLVNTLVDEKRRWWRRHERLVADLPERPGVDGPPPGDVHARLRAALRELRVGPRPAPSSVDPRYWDDSHLENLWVRQKNGAWLPVQIWDARGWANADITDFGAGIHVLARAKKGVG